jgi:hypothetical protein
MEKYGKDQVELGLCSARLELELELDRSFLTIPVGFAHIFGASSSCCGTRTTWLIAGCVQ